MTNIEPDFEILSAYVDGELSPVEMSQLEALMERDQRIASKIKKLMEIKSGVAQVAADVVILQLPVRRSHWHIGLIPAIAAALCMVAFGALTWTGLLHQLQGEHNATVAQAVVLHDEWVSNKSNSATLVAAVQGFEPPQLSAAGLHLVGIRSDIVLADKTHAIQANYVGEHGCRLSLFELSGADIREAFHIASMGNLQSATWTFGPSQYIAIARELDTTRFAVVAAAMKAMTAHLGPPPADVVAQLESAHQPCKG